MVVLAVVVVAAVVVVVVEAVADAVVVVDVLLVDVVGSPVVVGKGSTVFGSIMQEASFTGTSKKAAVAKNDMLIPTISSHIILTNLQSQIWISITSEFPYSVR